MNAKPIRVLLVDDHAPFRQGVAALLDAQRDFDFVGEAEDGVQALETARTLVPDVVLMDLSMPRMGGLEATRHLKAEMPCVRIVILTSQDDDRSVFDAVRCGAHAYLAKTAPPSAILQALRAAARGEPSITPSVATRLLEELATATPAATPPATAESGLTRREHEALRLMADGTGGGAIADALGIAEAALGNLLQNIFAKVYLGDRLRSRSDASSLLPQAPGADGRDRCP